MPGKLVMYAPAFSTLILISSLASAQPLIINHQGLLLDETGKPEQGEQILRIALFEQPAGGTALWWEDHQVTLLDGFYAVTLGRQASLEGLFREGERYLGVSVVLAGDTVEIPPRRRITAVPWAMVSADAAGDITPNSVSVGGLLVIDSNGRWVGPELPVADLPPYLTGEELFAALLTLDGPGSRLDADLLDGRHANDLISKGAKLLAVLRAVDGAGSGFDADLLDGHHVEEVLITAEQLRDALRTLAGAGSELDFDLLDGLDSTQFLRADENDTLAGNLTVQGRIRAAGPLIDSHLATKSYADSQVRPAVPCPARQAARGFDLAGMPLCVAAAPPGVAAIAPASGPVAGGTAVTVSGRGFAQGARLFIGTSEAAGVVVVNDTTLTALTAGAPQASGPLAVTVLSAGGQAGVLPAAFSYQE